MTGRRKSRGQGKYHVSPPEARTYNGVTYDSKKEADYARQLDLLTRARGPERIVRWSPQCAVPLIVNGKTICLYYADFYVEFLDGRREYHEVKGCETDIWKIKKKLFEAIYPEKKLIVVK